MTTLDTFCLISETDPLSIQVDKQHKPNTHKISFNSEYIDSSDVQRIKEEISDIITKNPQTNYIISLKGVNTIPQVAVRAILDLRKLYQQERYNKLKVTDIHHDVRKAVKCLGKYNK